MERKPMVREQIAPLIARACLLVTCCWPLLAVVAAYAQQPVSPQMPEEVSGTVVSVRVVGNRYVNISRLPQLSTRVGSTFDVRVLEEDKRTLAGTGKFLDVQPKLQEVPGGIAVFFEVVEKPLIRYLKFVGNEKVSDRKLKTEVQLEVGGAIDPYAIQDGKRRIEEFYRNRGFNNVEVRVVEGLDSRDHGVVYFIDEGFAEKVRWTSFVGNTIASDSRLRTQIQTKPGVMWLFKGQLDNRKLDEDIERLTNYYRSLGFFQARISRELSYSSDGRWVTVTFIINEGPRYKVRNIQIIGNKVFESFLLIDDPKLQPGMYFDQVALAHDIMAIKSVYESQGYVFVSVNPEQRFDLEPGHLDLILQIEEGDRYRVGKIYVTIKGENPRTQERVVRDRMSLKPGDIVDARKLRDSERRLKASGLFQNDPASGKVPKIVFTPPEEDEDRPTRTVSNFRGAVPPPGVTQERVTDVRLYYESEEDFRRDHPEAILETADADAPWLPLPTATSTPVPTAVPVPASTSMPQAQPQLQPQPLPLVPFPASQYDASQEYTQAPQYSAPLRHTTHYSPDGQQPAPQQQLAQQPSRQPLFRSPVASNPVTNNPVASNPAPSSQFSANPAPPVVRGQEPARQPLFRGQNENSIWASGGSQASGTQTHWSQSSGVQTAGGQAVGASGPEMQALYQTAADSSEPMGLGLSQVQYQQPYMGQPGSVPDLPAAPVYGQGQQLYQPSVIPGTGYPVDSSQPAYGSMSPGSPQFGGSLIAPPPGAVVVDAYGNVVPQYAWPGSEPLLDLFAEVEEAPTGRFMLGIGVNSDAGVVGNVVIDEQNFDIKRPPSSWEDVRSGKAFRGAGQRFRIEASPGNRVQRYAISFGEPYFYIPGIQEAFGYSISASYYERIFRDWDEERISLRNALSYQLRPDLTLTGAFRVERVGISEVTVPTPPDLADVEGYSDLYGFKLQLTNDTRDSPFMPTQGHLIDLGFEQVIGTYKYPRFTAEGRQYYNLHQRPDGSGRHVLAVGGRVGFAGDETPIYDHFYAGGSASLRGFRFRGASPREMNVIVGGEFEMLGTVEYMFPISADDMLRGVVFTDFGTVERDIRIDGDNFRVAPGFGLRVNVPALGPAPIALDFAFPIADAAGDEKQVFSFSVGAGR